MATDAAADRKPTRPNGPPPEPEHLPCPRCDSTNTKFCYYNNYNFSQPRHFCKACRRYWTHGGTLRDIPVGGGSRKNAKRSRTTSFAAPVFEPTTHHPGFSGAASQLLVHDGDAKMCGSFTSLLNTHGNGFWALGGFGIGPGVGLDDVGFGLGRTAWPFRGVVEGGAVNDGGSGHTWQLENGEGGFGAGDCFALPDLAISTPGGSYMK